MKLDDLRSDSVITGIEPGQAVRVVSVEMIGESAATVVFRKANGQVAERMLFRADETSLSAVSGDRRWGFTAAAGEFRLGAEAHRIHLAHLFDPLMAVHTSNVDPLPHQIQAVYEEMLPKQPLRFVLADDPGAGKTIMAGLLVRELMVRGDLQRCLIIAPGSLTDQWQDELSQKFNLSFELFSRELVEACGTANPFAERNLLIARVDQLARAEDLQEKLLATEWDLIICDEAHKLSASYFGNELKKTQRYLLGEKVGRITRHLLLMTATPHNGKEEDFQAFMALLDSDRFYGKYRDGVHQMDTTGLMRRMIKEELVKFDGTPLFPERIAETVNYPLSNLETALYQAVTDYVSHEMNRARNLDGKRRGTVGFALTILQRRLASSPEAIYQSLKRRLGRLEIMLEEAKTTHRGLSALANLPAVDETDVDDAYSDLPDEELETLENEVVDQATAAKTVEELAAEIASLRKLVALAAEVHRSGQDYKWRELSSLLEDNPHMRDGGGVRRKLIVFTEHRDTLNYLHDRISTLLGNADAIEMIHGGVKREERRKAVERFTNYADCTILLATDAAGEGVNLQVAHLMVNYDLPWNPNRLEQRFGRIHRIGQTEVCRLWNLVSKGTREGEVFHRLFEKLEQERATLGGKVFDVLGQVFEERPLKDLLMEAVCYGDQPEVRDRLNQVVDHALDHDHLKELIRRGALASEHLDPAQVFAIKERMDQAEALRLQPFFIQSFFEEAFRRLGGTLSRRESKRFEISHVPAVIRQRDRLIGTKAPVVARYHRICFEKSEVRLPQRPMATFVAPGHPLMDATVDLILERHQSLLREGSVLVNRRDAGTEPRVLFILDHSIKDGSLDVHGQPRVISRRLQFVLLGPDGQAIPGGPAPYLDYDEAQPAELALAQETLQQPWFGQNIEKVALTYAATHLVPTHFEEVRGRRLRLTDATLEAVHARLTAEINFWTHRYQKLATEMDAGRQPRMQPVNAKRRAEDLAARLEQRTRELEARRQIISATPVVVGAALVLPQGLIDQRLGSSATAPSADAAARTKMERIGMEATMASERALGFTPHDVSAENLGWDITSSDGRGNTRFLEVKARAHDSTTITVSKNEMMVGFNKKNDGWFLALVLVDPEGNPDGPHYLAAPFEREPGWAETSVNLDIARLLQRARGEQTEKPVIKGPVARGGGDRLTALGVAEVFGLSMAELAAWLKLPEPSLMNVPADPSLQNLLLPFEAIARLRKSLGGDLSFRQWLRTPHPMLGQKPPLEIIAAAGAQVVADLSEDMLTGQPS